MERNLCLVQGRARVRRGHVVRDRGDGGLRDHEIRLFPCAHDQGGDHGEDHGVDHVVRGVRRQPALKQVVTVAWALCPSSLLARAQVVVEVVGPAEWHALVLVFFLRNSEVVEAVHGDRLENRSGGRGEYGMAFQRWDQPIPREG